MKNLIVLSTLLLLSFTAMAADSQPSDRHSEQIWKVVSKSRYTRSVRKNETTRLPASVKVDHEKWFDQTQSEFSSNEDFDFNSSFEEIDQLI